MASLAAIKTRIEALWSALGVTVLTGDETEIGPNDLPAVMVYKGGATREQYTLGDNLRVVRTFDNLLYVAEVKKSDRSADLMAAIDACDAYLDGGASDVAAYFANRPRLQLAGVGLVPYSGPMSDDGPTEEPHGSKKYSTVLFRLPVVVWA